MGKIVRILYLKHKEPLEALYEKADGDRLQGPAAIDHIVRVEFYRNTNSKTAAPYHCLDVLGDDLSEAKLNDDGRLTLKLRCIAWMQSGAAPKEFLLFKFVLDGRTRTYKDGVELVFAQYCSKSLPGDGTLRAASGQATIGSHPCIPVPKLDPLLFRPAAGKDVKFDSEIHLAVRSPDSDAYLLSFICSVREQGELWMDSAIGRLDTIRRKKNMGPLEGPRVEWTQSRETVFECKPYEARAWRRWLLHVCELTPDSAESLWNSLTSTYLEALTLAEGGSDMSFVPTLRSARGSWAVSLLVEPHGDPGEPSLPTFALRTLEPRASAGASAFAFPKLPDRDDPNRILTYAGQPKAVSESFRASTSMLNVQVGALGPIAETEPEESWLRIGSLDLALPRTQAEGAAFEITIEVVPIPLESRAHRRQDANPQITHLALLCRQFDVIDPRGGAEDALPDAARSRFVDRTSRDEREQAIARYLQESVSIVLQLDAPNKKLLAQLGVEESTAPNRSRGLVLRLARPRDLEPVNSSAYTRLAYISREPFHVSVVEVAPLARLEQDYDEIANRSLSELEGSRWELAAAGSGFSLLLPPQTIGEEMEKSLEQPIWGQNRSLDYRLGSPARLRLRSSYFRQRSAEAPWNLRRVLGYPGQRAPGALVQHLRFELAYGLMTEVDAGGVPTRLHVAELGSRVGALSEPVERRWVEGKGYQERDRRRDVFFDYRVRWARALAAYRGRLAVFELYAPGEVIEQPATGPTIATGTLTLDRGLTFTLRKAADLKYPIPPDRIGDPVLSAEDPHHPNGLKGGVTWPFESDAIYRSLWREPRTSAGQISRVFFSSLGGYGQQRAAFDNRRTLINTSTVMGRLTRVTVERIGRIAVLWNRAKHVIVYERTTLPGQQFEKTQYPHVGRAVLRKVEEYVEILQREREYPEYEQTKLPRGFIEASSFVTWRIPVDGNWGRDIDGGFEIPLWRRDADPRIYPKPVVNVVQSGDKQEITVRVATAIATPERLYFYSSVDPRLDDQTDLWPAARNVDYVDEPRPEPEEDDPLDPGEPDGMLADSPLDADGWERQTWQLESPAQPANLVAERTENALTARIQCVTMMRAVTTAATDASAEGLRAAARIRTSLAQSRGDLLNVLSSAEALTDDVRANVRKEIARTETRVTKLAGAAQTAKGEFERKRAALRDWDVKRRCEDAKKEVQSRLTASIAAAKRVLDEWRVRVDRELQEFNEKLPRARAHEYVDRWAVEADLLVRRVSCGLEEVQSALEGLRDRLEQARSALLAEFDRFVEPLEAGGLTLEDAQALVFSLDFEIDAWLQSVTASLPQTFPERARGAIQQIRDRLARDPGKDIKEEIRSALKSLRDLLGQITEPYLPPLATEVEATRAAIFGDLAVMDPGKATGLAWLVVQLDHALRELDGVYRQIVPEDQEIAEGLKELIKGLRDAIDAMTDPLVPGDLREAVNDGAKVLVDSIDAFGGHFGTALTDLDKLVCQGALAWKKDLDSLIDSWGFDKLGEELEKKLANIAGSGIEACRKLYDELDSCLSQALDNAADLYSGARAALKDFEQSPTFQNPGQTLRLIRAVGEGPLLPEMKFNRNRMAYFFDDYAAAVRTSPAAALVNRVGDDLKALGLRLPTTALLDRIVPDSLQNFDIGKIFPDFAALRNNELFRKVKLPAIANDRVRVQHGLDKATQSAWLKANVDVPLSGKTDVFNCGPLTLRLLKADFRARSEMTVTVGLGMRKHTEGEIVGDWQLAFGGAPLVTFARTLLHFDASGRMHFDIRAENIQMDRALQWLADLVKKVGSGKDGFALELMQLDGKPIGVRCSLCLPLPSISGGAFSISGLSLGASLMLFVDPETREFTIGAAFNLGAKLQPFTLTISFLGGGGWLESFARYVPATGLLRTDVSIGMVAGAGAEFAFGPARGSVYLQFGIFIEFHSDSTRRQSLSIGIMLLVRGNVVLCGFIDIGLMLLLQAIYQETGTVNAYGTLSVTVKISRFFKIKVRQQVKYKLAGKGKKSERDAPPSEPVLTQLAVPGAMPTPSVPAARVSLAVLVLRTSAKRARRFQ